MPRLPLAHIYIDGANVFYSQRHLGWSIDFLKLKKYLSQNFQISQISYYTGLKENDRKMQKFLTKLEQKHINVITKPLKKIFESGRTIYKSNFDVEMTINILENIKKFKVCVLVSGDSDFHALVKKLHRSGKRVVAVSTRKMLSWELKLEVDQYLFFEDLGNLIKKTSGTKPELHKTTKL